MVGELDDANDEPCFFADRHSVFGISPIAASQTEPTETPKMMVRELLRKMSEEATFEEILYEIETLAGVIRGVEEADAGKGIPHEEFLEQIKKWNLK